MKHRNSSIVCEKEILEEFLCGQKEETKAIESIISYGSPIAQEFCGTVFEESGKEKSLL